MEAQQHDVALHNMITLYYITGCNWLSNLLQNLYNNRLCAATYVGRHSSGTGCHLWRYLPLHWMIWCRQIQSDTLCRCDRLVRQPVSTYRPDYVTFSTSLWILSLTGRVLVLYRSHGHTCDTLIIVMNVEINSDLPVYIKLFIIFMHYITEYYKIYWRFKLGCNSQGSPLLHCLIRLALQCPIRHYNSSMCFITLVPLYKTARRRANPKFNKKGEK